MSEPTIKKPSKKAFHFPKGADKKASAEKKQAEASTAVVESAPVVEAAPVVESTPSVKASKKSAGKAASKAAGKKSASKPAKQPASEAASKPANEAASKPAEKAADKSAEKPAEKPVEKSASAKKSPKAASGPSIRTKAVKADAPVKAKRAKKDKVVRDSFTMPKSDYEKIAALKLKCQEAGVSVKKSELLRAGLQMLDAASQNRLVAAIAAVEQVKTGRPAKA
jgi:hypothetical protein